MPARVAVFFGLAFALSWAWWIPLAVGGRTVERGDAWPTHIPGLLGPLLAAFIVLAATEGRPGVRRWAAAFVRWPRDARRRLAALAPLGFLALGLAIAAVAGEAPAASDFLRFSGTTSAVGALLVALVIGAFGEEAGWRGYALPRLQVRLGPLRATLLLALVWAAWHVPLFFLLESFGDFSPLTVPAFCLGLTAGALVLTSVFNGTGGSILAVGVWHAAYNLSAGTEASDGTIAAVSTACVVIWAVSIVRAGGPA